MIGNGMFYIGHEFNKPVLKLLNPTDDDAVSGEFTISGTIEDDSDIEVVIIEIEEVEGDYRRSKIILKEDIVGNQWSITIDSIKLGLNNGEYIIEVYAADEYLNYSDDICIKIYIEN